MDMEESFKSDKAATSDDLLSTDLCRPPDVQDSSANMQGKDYEAFLHKRLVKKQPSPEHYEILESLYFPGWDTRPSPPKSPKLHTQQQTSPHPPAQGSTLKGPFVNKKPSSPQLHQMIKQTSFKTHSSSQKGHVHLPRLESTSKSQCVNKKPPSPQHHQMIKDTRVHLPPLESTSKLSQDVALSDASLDSSLKEYIHKYNPNDIFSITSPLLSYDFALSGLEKWKTEYENHRKLLRIPFFAHFKKWKSFYVWRRKVCAKKFHLAREKLEERLFLVNPCLSPALLDIRNMCCQLSDTGFCHWKKKYTYTLEELKNALLLQLEKVLDDLERFEHLVKEVTFCACRDFLETKTKSIEPDKSQFTRHLPKINKVLVLNRLVCFIYLVDCVVINTLHRLVVDAVDELLAELQMHVCQTPSHAIIQSWDRNALTSAEPPDTDVTKKPTDPNAASCKPFFTSELILETCALTFKPSEGNFQETTAEIISRFHSTAMTVKTLSAHPDVDLMCRSEDISGWDITRKKGLCLEFIFENDFRLQRMKGSIEELLAVAFDAAKVYSHTFHCFLTFYKENERLDVEALRHEDPGSFFFEKALEKYHRQHQETLAVEQKRRLGLLLVDNTQFRDRLLSSLLHRLEGINRLIAHLAKHKLDSINAEVSEAKSKLQSQPITTEELACSFIFQDEIQKRISAIDEDKMAVCKMYDLINTYSIPTSPEDLLVFDTLEPSIESLHTVINAEPTGQDSSMKKFHISLKKDIKELQSEVEKVKLSSQDPQILDAEAESSEVRLLLGQIQLSIDELLAQAATYATYQKRFKLEVTRFYTLEDLTAEFRIKRLLWDCRDEWDALEDGWQQSTLQQLDLEMFGSEVNKYSKYVTQLEKGLPSNNLVQSLKEKVEVVKQRMPIMSDLRNPCMKAEHWKSLEFIIGPSVNVEECSVAALDKINVFSFGSKIQEVSGQASGEASVEAVIGKVEEVWKSTKFTVLPHGDNDQVFILGGTDDIQVLLDDSIINVRTVASSRYVTPIKHRVDKLLQKLMLFNQTLDEWLTCQRNWLYLESIFVAPDIKRQLPAESKKFLKVDKSWKEIMTKVQRVPIALRAATRPDLLETFKNNNMLLDDIQKCLEDYLESKRVIFPRFYFLSNDELLKILAQTRNPQAVQPHLRKCFDAINQLEFALLPENRDDAGQQETGLSKNILSMVSPEGEKVGFAKALKAQGNVENWLCKVEESMFSSLRLLSKKAIADYQEKSREEWVVAGHPSQVVLTVSQLMWCREMDSCLEEDHHPITALQQFELTNFDRLNVLAGLVRGHLPALHRNIITALITIDVHARDIVTDLVKKKVNSRSDFEWQRQLRYYWDPQTDTCVATMARSTYNYGYEYLGACPRLVITPLTVTPDYHLVHLLFMLTMGPKTVTVTDTRATLSTFMSAF